MFKKFTVRGRKKYGPFFYTRIRDGAGQRDIFLGGNEHEALQKEQVLELNGSEIITNVADIIEDQDKDLHLHPDNTGDQLFVPEPDDVPPEPQPPGPEPEPAPPQPEPVPRPPADIPEPDASAILKNLKSLRKAKTPRTAAMLAILFISSFMFIGMMSDPPSIIGMATAEVEGHHIVWDELSTVVMADSHVIDLGEHIQHDTDVKFEVHNVRNLKTEVFGDRLYLKALKPGTYYITILALAHEEDGVYKEVVKKNLKIISDY